LSARDPMRRIAKSYVHSYGLVLCTNLIGLSIFAIVIATGIILNSAAVILVGSIFSLQFLFQAIYLIRLGRDGWNALLRRSPWRR
jgi:uncharacterized membrane protein